MLKKLSKLAEHIETLTKLSHKLDQTGQTDLSDQVDKIVIKMAQEADYLGRTSPMDLTQPDMSSVSVPDSGAVERYQHAQSATPGAIKIPGDPFTYDYVSDGDYFVVRTAPDRDYRSVGAKITSTSPAYQKLKDIMTGQVSATPVKTVTPLSKTPKTPEGYHSDFLSVLHKLIQGTADGNFGKPVQDAYFKRNTPEANATLQKIIDPKTSSSERIQEAASASHDKTLEAPSEFWMLALQAGNFQDMWMKKMTRTSDASDSLEAPKLDVGEDVKKHPLKGT